MALAGPIKTPVSNRGVPPFQFLTELVTWGSFAPYEIFAPKVDDKRETDIYTYIKPILAPNGWDSPLHRRAAMLEVMRVLAGFESSWDWNCGRDITNSTSISPTTIEAGAWQVSGNSRAFGQDLRELAPADGNRFQRAMKSDHPLAMEYIARLLRHTIRHNGPVVRHEIGEFLNTHAVTQFMSLIKQRNMSA